MKIRILIVDDHTIVREGLRSLFENHQDMQIVGEADDGYKAVRIAGELRPDVVIMDIAMPHLNGIEATRRIIEQGLNTRVIALSMYADKRFVREMLKAGVSGYIVKDSAFDEIVHAVRIVYQGKMYLSTEIVGMIAQEYVRCATSHLSAAEVLSSREREILQQLCEGKTTKQIAAHLKISVKTVETYRSRIMKKLNTYTIPELIKYAVREGITSLEQ